MDNYTNNEIYNSSTRRINMLTNPTPRELTLLQLSLLYRNTLLANWTTFTVINKLQQNSPHLEITPRNTDYVVSEYSAPNTSANTS